jgi:hypothetical protein
LSIDAKQFFKSACGAALKTITAELPPDGKIAATACAKLTPKLLGQIASVSFNTFLTLLYLYDLSANYAPRSSR